MNNIAFPSLNAPLQQVIERVKQSKGAVVFLPSIGWNIVLFQRPHHLARAYAQRGHVAIFDCNGTYDDLDGFKEIEPNLFLFKGDPQLLAAIPNPLLWSFTYNFNQFDRYPDGTRILYDWIDDLEVFAHDQQFLADSHERAMREATVVASVAMRLHRQALNTRRDALYLPNGVEDQRFGNEEISLPDDPALNDWLASGRPLAGYYGALASWFDADLLNEVARLRPDWNFVLIGPNYDDSLPGHPVLKRANVRWLGPRDYATLPGYLKAFTVATIPFVINDITLATSPLKLYEYFAGGKPVITTPMPECMSFPEVQIVRTAAEFAVALDEAQIRHADESFRAHVRALAHRHSWHERAKESLRVVLSPPPGIETKKLSDDALAVAEQFQGYQNAYNRRFFAALATHFAALKDSSVLPLYFNFAVTCNERGRTVAQLLTRYTQLAGKKYLDVGCAYGGFLVAFAEAGADVAGFDINETLLGLAKFNLQDQGIQAPLLLRDATQRAEVTEFADRYDVITCNDVIEHVTDPQALLRHVASMLREGGLAYFEIPNGKASTYISQDGHYQLYGITLLDYPEATRYYLEIYPNGSHDVYSYFTLARYGELFKQAGLEMTVLDESLLYHTEEQVHQDLQTLQQTLTEKLQTVPESVRPLVEEKVQAYLAETAAAPRASEAEKRDFMFRYGAGFWKVIARKIPA